MATGLIRYDSYSVIFTLQHCLNLKIEKNMVIGGKEICFKVTNISLLFLPCKCKEI